MTIAIVRRSISLSVVLASACAATPDASELARQQGRGNPNPTIVPFGAHPDGLSYAEWGARWFQWQFSLPADANPVVDTADCSAGQVGHVWFLAGANQSTTETRNCSIPAGTALFFPVANVFDGAENLPPPYGVNSPDPVGTARANASTSIATASGMAVTIDGAVVQEVTSYFVDADSSPVFEIPLPPNNLLGIPSGDLPNDTIPNAVHAGYYLFLTPPPAGEHTLRIQGSIGFFGVTFDVTYDLEVGSSAAP
jgi:hypothetical protein